jgi:mercuric ion transport protein
MGWQKVRTGIMLVGAAVTCPCHIPLTLPFVLALLAGTPAAIWLGQNVGWVYGGMTVLFLLSLAIGLRWMQANVTSRSDRQSVGHVGKSGEQAIPEGGRDE